MLRSTIINLLVLMMLTFCLDASMSVADGPPVRPNIEPLENSIGMALVNLPPGQFLMGSPASEKARSNDERQHRVQLTKPFAIGQYEVTQAEFRKVMGDNPSFFAATGLGDYLIAGQPTDRFPVEYVKWEEVLEFCQRLSNLPAEKAAGRSYRLPTEAEWEYACRAGTESAFCFGAWLSADQANFNGNISRVLSEAPKQDRQQTIAVGSFPPNAWGLYDMHGNVFEWCSDYYAPNYYARSPMVDPTGPTERSIMYVTRGGAWGYHACHCRSAYRSCFVPGLRDENIGFRVVCDMTKAK